ncbi:hypothetical protein JCM17960_02500 [Magnetospira thiophila]
MALGGDGHFQLGADAVGAGHQHRIVETRRLEIEQRAKSAEAGEGAGTVGGPGQWLDLLDQRLSRVYIYTGVLVTEGVANGFLP